MNTLDAALVEPILSVRDLSVRFSTRDATIYAVNGVSFDLLPGESLGIVGESGCGKSVSALAALGLLPRNGSARGEVFLEGSELLSLDERRLRRTRGSGVAMVFQDPMTSLNPVLRIGKQITEALTAHLGMDEGEARAEAISLLERVGIPDAARRIDDYPHQFSGGMRQRVMIAIAISCKPKVVVADEPTTALDVTIQAQILELLRDLVEVDGRALVLITHDLGVVAGMCDRTNVMYAGRFVETGQTQSIFAHPLHPYTLGLLQSVPRLDRGRGRKLKPIGGSPRDQREEPKDCAFASRCSKARDRCRAELPRLEQVGERQFVACFYPVTDQERGTGEIPATGKERA